MKIRNQVDSNYIAACDLSPKISCSNVFSSPYGNLFSSIGLVPLNSLFDQPNMIYGAVFYIVTLLTPDNHFFGLALLTLSTLSMCISAYLSYLMAYALKATCIVCIATYVCNFAIFLTYCLE